MNLNVLILKKDWPAHPVVQISGNPQFTLQFSVDEVVLIDADLAVGINAKPKTSARRNVA